MKNNGTAAKKWGRKRNSNNAAVCKRGVESEVAGYDVATSKVVTQSEVGFNCDENANQPGLCLWP